MHRIAKFIFLALTVIVLSKNQSALAAEFSSQFASALKKEYCAQSGKVSMMIKSIDTGEVLFAKDPDELMVPASNMKIVTAFAALDILGPMYTYKTHIRYTGKKNNGAINGDLVIKGEGDPHFVTEDLFLLVNEIRKRGITKISGNLILDDSWFDEKRFPDGWAPSSQRRAYEAPLGALSLNFNSFTISVYPSADAKGRPHVSLDPETDYFTLVNNLKMKSSGRSRIWLDYKPKKNGGEIITIGGEIHKGTKEKVFYRSVKRPIMFFGHTLIKYLSMHGISLDGQIKRSSAPDDSKELFVYESKPLYELVAYMNKYSNNFMAETILRTIASEKDSVPGSDAAGVKLVEEYLKSKGFWENSFVISDGSGFTRSNRLTASLIAELLEKGYKSWRGGPEFITSLAVMGRDGSVEDRLTSTDKIIRVKTGTLKSVSALSGYYPLTSGGIISFSMLFNDLPCENGELLDMQNRLLKEFGKIDAGKN